MKKKQPLPPTCAFCSYRWPPLKPGDVPRDLVCPVCKTRIQFGPRPHLRPVPPRDQPSR